MTEAILLVVLGFALGFAVGQHVWYRQMRYWIKSTTQWSVRHGELLLLLAEMEGVSIDIHPTDKEKQ